MLYFCSCWNGIVQSKKFILLWTRRRFFCPRLYHPQIQTFPTPKNQTFARRTTATPNFFLLFLAHFSWLFRLTAHGGHQRWEGGDAWWGGHGVHQVEGAWRGGHGAHQVEGGYHGGHGGRHVIKEWTQTRWIIFSNIWKNGSFSRSINSSTFGLN